jgi:plasmid stabilization system protein ParE
MKKERRNIEEIDRFIGETFGVSPAKSSNEQTAAEFRARGMKNIQEQK